MTERELLGDIKSAMDKLEKQLQGQSTKFERTYAALQVVIDLAGEWMKLRDLESLRDEILRCDVSLNEELGEVRDRFAGLISDADTVIGRTRHTRGYFLDPIRPIHRPVKGAGAKGKPPHSEPTADVIFVHGLDGDAYATWRHDPIRPYASWPYWLAEELLHVKFWTLGYPAASSELKRNQGLALEHIAEGSLEALRGRAVGGRALMFVAHSLGGLVVKKMIHRSVSLSNDEPGHEHGFLKDRVRGVVFLGTPHSGANLATLAHALSFFYRCTITMEYLRKNHPTIDELGDWFRKYADKNRDIHIHAHCEMKKLAGLSGLLKCLVVELSSADPHIAHAKVFKAAERDHITICKCKSDDEVYKKTRDMILAIAPRA
ncbi:MAG: esterase/lipase family protein [Isosphaeraceae bacterium]